MCCMQLKLNTPIPSIPLVPLSLKKYLLCYVHFFIGKTTILAQRYTELISFQKAAVKSIGEQITNISMSCYVQEPLVVLADYTLNVKQNLGT